MIKKVTVIISFIWILLACNNMQENEDNDSGVPVGISDYGNMDKYIISGTVKDEEGNPVSNFTITLAYEYGDNQFGYIPVTNNSLGEYSFIGLHSWSNAQSECDIVIATSAHVEIVANVHPGNYERSLYWALKINNYPEVLNKKTMSVNMVLRKVVKNTTITGTIKNDDGSIVPKNQINLLDLVTSQYSQGPAYGVKTHTNNEFFFYNESTGEYKISNCLAGGNYLINLNVPNLYFIQQGITVTPGSTLVKNLVLSKGSE